MKVKRFEAPDTKSALALVKEELGHEAVILSTKTINPEPGRGGYGPGAPWVEVVAAVDFNVEETVNGAAGSRERVSNHGGHEGNGRRAPQAAANGAATRTPGRETARSPQDAPPADRLPRNGAAAAAYQPPSAEGPAAGINLSREARLLQQRFGTPPRGRQEADPLSESPTPRQRPTNTPPRSPAKNSRPAADEVDQWRQQILEQLQVRPLNLAQQGAGPVVIALVGPTGVGKTTTAAKLAAWFTLHENARVALLSMDCYRIGATDQLRTYARIMRLPCEITMKEPELNAALRKHRDKDLIIIDTAGKSPFDENHIPELDRWFAPHAEILPYLVLSATAKKEDINRIIATYRPLGIPAAILTKLDETRAYAALCQQMTKAELPIACLCTGQKVPEDFRPASKDFLKTLFGQGWNAAMDLNNAAQPQQWTNQ
ncbi:MAG: flagellar biosynthesis protein FlhF [Desulfurivibrio sp.]|nr:flagellar biosynthesis protein FlhF [Desulfurivibrio sp.]